MLSSLASFLRYFSRRSLFHSGSLFFTLLLFRLACPCCPSNTGNVPTSGPLHSLVSQQNLFALIGLRHRFILPSAQVEWDLFLMPQLHHYLIFHFVGGGPSPPKCKPLQDGPPHPPPPFILCH